MKRIRLNAPPALGARPKCPQCRKPLRPYWITVKEERGANPFEWIDSQKWNGDYHGYGHFCSLRCCEKFANAVINQQRKR